MLSNIKSDTIAEEEEEEEEEEGAGMRQADISLNEIQLLRDMHPYVFHFPVSAS